MEPSKSLIEGIAVTVELTRGELSKDAMRVMAKDLAEYPEAWVLKALTRCRRELRAGQFTLAAVLERVDDGRPGPEEAWATLPKDEGTTVVWTDEMSQAWGIAQHLMDSPVQARMAFLERYRELVRAAREMKTTPRWWVTLGHDVTGREGPVFHAVQLGRITTEEAERLLPVNVHVDVVARIAQHASKALEVA